MQQHANMVNNFMLLTFLLLLKLELPDRVTCGSPLSFVLKFLVWTEANALSPSKKRNGKEKVRKQKERLYCFRDIL